MNFHEKVKYILKKKMKHLDINIIWQLIGVECDEFAGLKDKQRTSMITWKSNNGR